MECRKDCGVCCIILSISSYIPGMPEGKPTGSKCIHLTENMKCDLFNKNNRPEVCIKFNADEIICGKTREDAIKIMCQMENIDPSEFII